MGTDSVINVPGEVVPDPGESKACPDKSTKVSHEFADKLRTNSNRRSVG